MIDLDIIGGPGRWLSDAEMGDGASVVLAGDSGVSLRGPFAGLVLLLADPASASATSVTKSTSSTKGVKVEIDETIESAALRVGDTLAMDDAATGITVDIADGRLDVVMTQLNGTVRWDATGTLRVDETGNEAAMSVDGVAAAGRGLDTIRVNVNRRDNNRHGRGACRGAHRGQCLHGRQDIIRHSRPCERGRWRRHDTAPRRPCCRRCVW